jgi:hypothetical protein
MADRESPQNGWIWTPADDPGTRHLTSEYSAIWSVPWAA